MFTFLRPIAGAGWDPLEDMFQSFEHIPDAAVYNVGEHLRQGGWIRELTLFVVGVDGALCMTVPGLLSWAQFGIVRFHGCEQTPLMDTNHTHVVRDIFKTDALEEKQN